MDEFKSIGAKNANVDELIKKFSGVEKSVVEVVQKVKESNVSISELRKAMENTVDTGSKFGAALKTMAANVGISLAVNLAVQGISWLIHSQEKLRQETAEAADAHKESSASVEAYVSRYQELRQALSDAEGNETETYNIKKQLLELQTEINDRFGDEYGKTNLVMEVYWDKVRSFMDLEEAYGNKTGSGFYDSLISQTRERKELLEEKFSSSPTVRIHPKALDIFSATTNTSFAFIINIGRTVLATAAWQDNRKNFPCPLSASVVKRE
ncbi:MAG: hypothetical protein HFI68_03425 [Lachnospiraceae bacterium]|nr:hypothetical protein [Lachnospiraceae bacterium]